MQKYYTKLKAHWEIQTLETIGMTHTESITGYPKENTVRLTISLCIMGNKT